MIDSECPDDHLMVYINVTESDREKHHINRTSANSLLECTQKCFNDSRCFSLKYRQQDELSCLLTDFASSSCPEITLLPVNEIKYDIHTLITIDCIKCELGKPKNFLRSSEMDDNDETSSVSGSHSSFINFKDFSETSSVSEQSSTDTSQSLQSTLQNTINSISDISVCDPSLMKCDEDIWFIAEKPINSEHFDSLQEIVITNSIQECAKKCFDNCCKVEYNRTKITCVTCGSPLRSDRRLLKTPEKNFVDTGNDFGKSEVKDLNLTSILLEKSIQASEKLENVKAEKPSELVETSTVSISEQSMTASTSDTSSSPENKESVFQLPRLDPRYMEMTCVVVFEVNPEANLADFQAQDSVKVKRADHCAYLCFRDACTAAVFTPPTAPGNKGTCERRFDTSEKCNSTLRRDYYYKTNKPVYLQCFRCLPKKPQTKPPFEETTLQPKMLRVTSEAKFITETEESAESVETTLVPSMELTTVKTDSKETEKSVGITVFDTTNGNTGTSVGAEEGTDEVAQETTQTLETLLAMTETEASATLILTDTSNTEMTTSGSTIWSTINDEMFENNSSSDETEFGVSDSPTTVVSAQSIWEHQSTESRIQTLESDQTTGENQKSTPATAEELGVLRMSTIEAEVGHGTLSSGSQSTMEFNGTESVATDSTPNETEKPITTPSTVEVETMESEIPSKVVQTDSSTKAASSNSGREDEDTFSKGKKNGSLSNDVDETFQMKHYLQGCIVTFQAEPYSKRPAESSTGVQVTITAQTAEVCAGRCYQDGCTGAKYDPSSKECVLGFGGKHFCNNGPEHFFYKANETVWIHCTGCKIHKPGDEGINIMIQSSKTKATKKTDLEETLMSRTVTLTSTETVETVVQKVESTKLNEILQTKSDVTSKKSSFGTPKIERSTEDAIERLINEISTSLVGETSTETAKVSTTGKEITVESTMEKKEKISKEESSADDISTSTVAGKIAESERKKEITAAPFQATFPGHGKFQATFPGHDCTILFQVKPVDIHSKELTSKFISINETSTVKQCAKRCFMDGCVGAKFDPVKQECLLTFGDHHQCDENEQTHQSLETTEALWIHCISCKKEFTETTLGLLAQDTTTLPG
ncbi:unnamed protein product [Onchocerca ochengi]|uniref:Apple domain-containing protein n=1 Tax=Onchocerca ochengi TaxID=42157 RepID=A0A182EBS9_ONCOC|nr:unnamed protein product [Onchocerca ochengi]